MKQGTLKTFLINLLIISLPISQALSTEVENEQPITLRVALFPHIPDAKGDNMNSLYSYLEKNFNKSHPHIKLHIRRIQDSKTENFYNRDILTELFGKKKKELSDPPKVINGKESDPIVSSLSPQSFSRIESEEAFDLIEIDALWLDTLAKKDFISPFDRNSFLEDKEDWHPAAKTASYRPGQEELWGIPHWLCSHFIFTHKEASILSELSSLKKYFSQPFLDQPFLAMKMLGTWTSIGLYLDSYASSHYKLPQGQATPENLHSFWKQAITKPFNKAAIEPLKASARACTSPLFSTEINRKVHDEYKKDPELPIHKFVNEEVRHTAGFGESLHYIHKKNKRKSITYRHIPYSEKEKNSKHIPAVFVDLFILRKGIDPQIEKASVAFIKYINQPQIFEYITLSHDVEQEETRIPRYLIPATYSGQKALIEKKGPHSKYYEMFRQELEFSISMPVSGIPEIAKELSDTIIQNLIN